MSIEIERLIELVSILNVTAIPANLKTKEGIEKNKLELETESKSEGVPKKKQFLLSQGINQTFCYIFIISIDKDVLHFSAKELAEWIKQEYALSEDVCEKLISKTN